MDSLPTNFLDLIVIGMIILCTFLGLLLGFVRSSLYVLSWLGAISVTFFAFPEVQPYARDLIEHRLFADIAAGAALFLPTLILLFLLSSIFEASVRRSRLSALDRSLGMLAGLTVGSFLICVIFSVVESTWSDGQEPEWVKRSTSLPFLQIGAGLLHSIISDKANSFINDPKTSAKKLISPEKIFQGILNLEPTKTDDKLVPGYDEKERNEMRRLLESNQ